MGWATCLSVRRENKQVFSTATQDAAFRCSGAAAPEIRTISSRMGIRTTRSDKSVPLRLKTDILRVYVANSACMRAGIVCVDVRRRAGLAGPWTRSFLLSAEPWKGVTVRVGVSTSEPYSIVSCTARATERCGPQFREKRHSGAGSHRAHPVTPRNRPPPTTGTLHPHSG